MAVRIRESGEIVCAAMHPAMPGDVYIHDGVTYELTVVHRLLVTEPWDEGHSKHGLWWWRDEVPKGVKIEEFYR